MSRRLLLALFSMSILIGMLWAMLSIRLVDATGTIYIRADGSIEPSTANIMSFDNVTYTFTSNNYDPIAVERGNIVIDGAGYTLQNPGGEDNGILVAYNVNNVTIKNMRIAGFIGSGIFLTTAAKECKISDNVLTENGFGIESLSGSPTATIISGNKIINNTRGIYLQGGSGNYIYGNDIIANSRYAIRIHVATNNTISENSIIENNIEGYSATSIEISGGSHSNKFYHNNIVGDTPLVYHENINRSNVWDDGYPSGGNYWSDYSGRDPDTDGIGDTPHIIGGSSVNVDNYPLMSQIGTVTRAFTSYSKEVRVSSNSTVQEFSFSDTLKQISFNVTGADGTTGFCNITFPSELLWGTISIYKDDALLAEGADYAQTYNGTHYTFCITYTHTTHTLKIVGTEAIPEFQLLIILPLFTIVTLLAGTIRKRKRSSI